MKSGIGVLEANEKMHNLGDYRGGHNCLLKTQELAVLGTSLSSAVGGPLLSPLPAVQATPSISQEGKFSHMLKGQEVIHESPRGQVRAGWEREFQIRKVAQMGE